MSRKKHTDKELIAEISKLSAEETLTITEWPKITKGSHLTITEHENGKIDMTWDWEQLNKDIKNAIQQYEQRQSSDTVVELEIAGKKGSKTGTSKRKASSAKKGKKDEVV